MIISLCGDEFDKAPIIQNLQTIYGEKLLIINYFQEIFNERINNERLKQFLSFTAFHQEITKIVDNKINHLITNNQDKIILLISNNILERDINTLPWFKQSDLKILVTSNQKQNNQNKIWKHSILYNEDEFDYIICSKKNVYRKLVKSE